MSEQGRAVPLTELLRSVPEDVCVGVITSWLSDGAPNGTRNIPVGRYSRDAADKIESLQCELAEARARLTEKTILACNRGLELDRWRSITARKDPDDCADGIAELYENWQDEKARADRATSYAEGLAGLLRRVLDDVYALGDIAYATERDINAALAKQRPEEGGSQKVQPGA